MTDEPGAKDAKPNEQPPTPDSSQQPHPSPGVASRSATQLPGSAPPSAKSGPENKPAKRTTIRSLGDLLGAVYAGKRKRLNPKKSEIAEMRSAPALDPAQRETLLQLAAGDRTLERTRDLMLMALEKLDSPPLAGHLRQFVRHVLGHHPAFRMESLAGVLDNLPEAMSEEDALDVLRSQSYLSLRWPDGAKALSQKDASSCRDNALYCLLLWLRATRSLSLQRIQRHLHTALWAPAAGRYKTDAQKLKALLSARDPSAIAVGCSLLEARATEQSQVAAAAQRAQQRATEQAENLEQELADVETRLRAATANVERLTQDLDVARHAHADEKAHLLNDCEELRGRILRLLREEAALLDEGLHALKRNPPKVHVMLDHAERVIDGMKRAMERFKEE